MTVRVLDANNNLVTTDGTTKVTLAIGDEPGWRHAYRRRPGDRVGRVATFSGLSINKTGTGYTLAASDTTGGGAPHPYTSATSSTFDITHGAADHLAFTTNPTGSYTADDTISVTVRVQDVFDNTVTTGAAATASISLALSGGNTSTLLGTNPKSAVAGSATFSDLHVRVVGTGYKLTASSTPSFTAADSSLFNITPGAATHLSFGQQPTNTVGGQDADTGGNRQGARRVQQCCHE